MKSVVYIVVVVLLVLSCSKEEIMPESIFTDTSHTEEFLSDHKLYPDWLDDCDRFRPIFLVQYDNYPLVKEYLEMSMLYALIYQESMCKTRLELRKIYEQQGMLDNPSWKGGLMQVDGCFRWGAQYNCTRISKQIEYGFQELNNTISSIIIHAEESGILLSKEQVITLVLLGYNRGHYLSKQAIDIFDKLDSSDLLVMDGVIILENVSVYVNCTEKDVCMNDYQYIDISNEYAEMQNDFERAMLIACKQNYGSMHNWQGDYCTGKGYGLNYPKSIRKIHEDIIQQQQAQKYADTGNQRIRSEEFYIDDIDWSGYNWFIKTSIGKTGPGPNFFYLNSDSVSIENERLILRLQEHNSDWYSSEIVLSESLGYGKYSIIIESLKTLPDPNVVFGFFTYDLSIIAEPDYFHREIDFEIARWGQESICNAQFALQQTNLSQSMKRFNLTFGKEYTISFNWTEQRVHFEVLENNTAVTEWTYTGSLVPEPGQESVRLNLWVFGLKPLEEYAIAIRKFTFEAYNG